jgi:AbrB family looped-hinge helix DNA binding protein
MAVQKPLTRVVKPLAKGQITIPAEFRRRLGIDANTFLNLTLEEGKIEIIPLRLVPPQEGLREYSAEDIQRFIREDKLDPRTAAKIRKLLA